jgi:hypothetical protein
MTGVKFERKPSRTPASRRVRIAAGASGRRAPPPMDELSSAERHEFVFDGDRA